MGVDGRLDPVQWLIGIVLLPDLSGRDLKTSRTGWYFKGADDQRHRPLAIGDMHDRTGAPRSRRRRSGTSSATAAGAHARLRQQVTRSSSRVLPAPPAEREAQPDRRAQSAANVRWPAEYVHGAALGRPVMEGSDMNSTEQAGA